MRFLIISDIHSNLEALASVFLDLHNNSEEIDRVLILGDIVGYGVNPNECCAIVRFLKNGESLLKKEIQTDIQKTDIDNTDKKNIIDYIYSLGKKADVIVGNHDQRVIGQLNTVMAYAAGLSINWTKKVIHEDNIRFLNSLWLKKKLWRFGIELVHSTSVCPRDFKYVMNSTTLNYSLLHSKITFAGHTHKPAAYLYTKQERDVSASIFIPKDQLDKKAHVSRKRVGGETGSIRCFLESRPTLLHKSRFSWSATGRYPNGLLHDLRYFNKKVFLEKAEYNTVAVKTKVLEAALPFDLAYRIVSGI